MNDIWTTLAGLGDKAAAHVLLAASAIGLAIVIALPVAVWAGRNAIVRRISLGLASLVQTMPALALLALFFPILLSLRAVFGEGLPTLGFLPALLALTLYALLPMLRNAVTARENMEPGVLEAADAVGMTTWQKLRLVEAPLAAPYVMAGIRTAAVWTIGAATLSTTIGAPSLGDPIFAGLQTQNWSLVLAGCLASAGLALAADTLLGSIEHGLAVRRRSWVWGGAAAAALGIIASAWALYAPSQERQGDTVVIAAKQFSEQYILARLIGSQLEKAGYAVEYRDGLGSAVVHNAVSTGAIDISVDYTGTIWTNNLKRTDNPGREEMYRIIRDWEAGRTGTLVLGRLGFENAYALGMRADRAQELGVRSIADLAPLAPQLVTGGDPEWFERPEWAAVRDAYGLRFARQRNFAPTFMYNALKSGEVDVISAYTSDGRIVADRLVILEDPKGALPSYDAMVMLAPGRAGDAKLKAAIAPLLGKIDVTLMREANLAVDRTDGEKMTPEQAAEMISGRIGL